MTPNENLPRRGLLIVNADDWGRNQKTTDGILDCGWRVSSVSAMVYMADSERASRLALERGMEVGLHLNLTEPFSAPDAPKELLDHQRKVAAWLLRHRLAQTVFRPSLTPSFEFLVQAQCDAFGRLYGAPPARIDGHHHFHLSANVLLQRLLPTGTVVRRNFSFARGEKGIVNRTYRHVIDRLLASRHRVVDSFFAITANGDLQELLRIRQLATHLVVEVAVHPVERPECESLMNLAADPLTAIASPAEVRAWAIGDERDGR